MDIQQSIYKKLQPKALFPNQRTFWLAVAMTALNFILIGTFLIMGQVMRLPDPYIQGGAAGIGDISRIAMLASLWSIGNTLLLLAMIDASRAKKPEA